MTGACHGERRPAIMVLVLHPSRSSLVPYISHITFHVAMEFLPCSPSQNCTKVVGTHSALLLDILSAVAHLATIISPDSLQPQSPLALAHTGITLLRFGPFHYHDFVFRLISIPKFPRLATDPPRNCSTNNSAHSIWQWSPDVCSSQCPSTVAYTDEHV